MDFDNVFCPLMQENIDMGICFDIHMVVCGCAPVKTAPQKARDTENFIEVCRGCKNHRDD